jgi:CRP/FNR family transcriptional regulator
MTGDRMKGKSDMTQDWIADVPLLAQLDDLTKKTLRDAAIRKQIPRGSVIFRPGDRCVQFPLIVAGIVRVQRVTESGREIVLYRVSNNETCVLTTASLLSDNTYAAEGVAETDITAFIVPAERFANLMSASAGFRALVFDGYSKRIATLMSRIEEIVCTPINVRLAERLLELNGSDNRIAVTQQALAADLGTAREVVGRVMKRFEQAGWVKLSRGGAEITDANALHALADAERD